MQSQIFKGLEEGYENINTLDIPEDYSKYYLSHFSQNDTYTGKPILSSPFSYQFEDKNTGEMVKKTACKLCLIDDENEEYLDINLNLKKEDDIQENIFKGAVLFDFIASMRELEEPGCMEGFNVFKKMNLKSIRDVINDWDSLTIKILERTGTYEYHSFQVLKAEHNIKD